MIKPWEERDSLYQTEVFSQIDRMGAEITELRAALAARPVANKAEVEKINMQEVHSPSAPVVASVDTPEFQCLLGAWAGLCAEDEGITEFARLDAEAWAALIAHIDHHVASQVLAAQAGQVAVPEGWKLVPIDPTKEMIWACKEKYMPAFALTFLVAAYKHMVSVAPSPAKESK